VLADLTEILDVDADGAIARRKKLNPFLLSVDREGNANSLGDIR
jgi:hypothetical protein